MKPTNLRSHLTFANVTSLLALFLVLSGGTAVALNGANTVFSDDIVDHQVKAPDLAKLGFIPVRPNPQREFFDPCESGEVGIFCGGVGSSGYRGWRNLGLGYAKVAYARDGFGIVHLRGTMIDSSAPGPPNSIILPTGYRPPATQEFAVAFGNGSSGESLSTVQVHADGAVELEGSQPGAGTHFDEGVSLDGIEFKAE